ncbi:MAG: allantoinase AllB [Roseibacillus sp.]
MPDHDLLIHATLPDGQVQSLAVTNGTVTEVSPNISGTATQEIDATDRILIPSWIDSHVHFNEPGRANWEGLHTGSLALAAGGGTAFFDMPLNSSPPVTNRETFELKKTTALEKSHLDFALWGGLVPESLPHLTDMAQSGAIGFKAFMCHSGIDEYPAADSATLREGMKIAADLNLPVAVHAEIPHGPPATGTTMQDWLDSRPTTFETNAISLALELAAETHCALHIVHVTCPEGIALVTAAKKAGVNVTVETCPHYLLLDRTAANRIGPFAKCAPPLRPAETVAALWDCLRNNEIDTIGSDHSPSSPDLKTGDDIFQMWGGIAGIQHGFPLLLDHTFDLLPQTSRNVADRFRLPNKGRLAPGYDADFTLLQKNNPAPINDPQLSLHPHSPYTGLPLSHRVTATYLRGQLVTSQTRSRFLHPITLP